MTPRKYRLQQPQLIEPASALSPAQLSPAQPGPAQLSFQLSRRPSLALFEPLTSFHGNNESSPLSRVRSCVRPPGKPIHAFTALIDFPRRPARITSRPRVTRPEARADDANSSHCTRAHGIQSKGLRLRGQTLRGSRFRLGGSRGPSQAWLLFGPLLKVREETPCGRFRQ